MTRSPLRDCFGSLDHTSQGEVLSLLASAPMFKSPVTPAARPLLGRHTAVVCEAAGSASSAIFAAAATALGATVVRIRPSAARLGDRRSVHDAARMLGRLYCAVGCDGMQPSIAAQLGRWAGVPVFDALAGSSHPARLLGDLLTMSEHARKPLAEITLCVCGDAGSPLAMAWRRLAALTGVRLCVGLSGPGGTAHRIDFVCAAEPAQAAGCPPALLAVDHGGGELHALRAQQNENHRCIVQALLADTVG
jgi:ornithine carbamoyltransferase